MDTKDIYSKSPKIFISHSSKDESIASSLIDILEFLGIKDIFCSSVSGYGVTAGQDIFQCIRKEYENHNLFMIFIISIDYLRSPMCLNEMGAAWIMKNEYQTFILPKLNVQNLSRTCIGSNNIAISWDDQHISALLNDFKDNITRFFHLVSPNENRWENKRNDFIKKFKSYNPISLNNQVENSKRTTDEKIQRSSVQQEQAVSTNPEKLYNEVDIQADIHKIHEKLFLFERGQIKLESIRLNKIHQRIDSGSPLIEEVWNNGFHALKQCDDLTQKLQKVNKFCIDKYLTEINFIEVFIYYNMAMLWGKLPFEISHSYIMQSKPQEARFIYMECLKLLSTLKSLQGFDRDFELLIDILYSELFLSLGEYDQAIIHLKDVKITSEDKIFTLSSSDSSSRIDIYTKEYVDSLKNEAMINDTLQMWMKRVSAYGTWAALKRINKAQSILGIKNEELLFPIPYKELCINPYITQNPGY